MTRRVTTHVLRIPLAPNQESDALSAELQRVANFLTGPNERGKAIGMTKFPPLAMPDPPFTVAFVMVIRLEEGSAQGASGFSVQEGLDDAMLEPLQRMVGEKLVLSGMALLGVERPTREDIERATPPEEKPS